MQGFTGGFFFIIKIFDFIKVLASGHDVYFQKKSNADKNWKNQYFLNSTRCSLYCNDMKLCLKELRKILKISGEIVFQKLLKK